MKRGLQLAISKHGTKIPSRQSLKRVKKPKNPLIIGFGAALVNQSWFNGWGLECCVAMGRIAVEKARIPVAFILNEAHNLGQGMRGIKLGFNVIMIHTSNLSYEKFSKSGFLLWIVPLCG